MRDVEPVARRRLAVLIGIVALAAGTGLAAAVTALGNGPLPIDERWAQALGPVRGPGLLAAATVSDFVGGGWFAILVVPLVVAALLLLARRPWAALAFVVALAASAVLVQLLKRVLDRARPEGVLVAVDPGSFPSGHTANVATIAVVLGLLLARWWVWTAGAVALAAMAFARTLLDAHWLSDTVGGALLGAGVGLLTWAAFAGPIGRRRSAGALGGADH